MITVGTVVASIILGGSTDDGVIRRGDAQIKNSNEPFSCQYLKILRKKSWRAQQHRLEVTPLNDAYDMSL
jgi:hypothetical protein